MALVYLLSIAVSLVVLAVALRLHPAPTPPTPPRVPATPAALDPGAAAEIHVILTAATQLAARLTTAA
ncbi:hypothetical protein [Streptomyces sp. WAC01280]|uniref:hypothetical protein n=1 Tax=Streptomyces sp. WAC01280 TaxID=2487424 RepID=UPI00163B78DB|nr:hypothetical protein [Streptomyces sp. WAC01280]